MQLLATRLRDWLNRACIHRGEVLQAKRSELFFESLRKAVIRGRVADDDGVTMRIVPYSGDRPQRSQPCEERSRMRQFTRQLSNPQTHPSGYGVPDLKAHRTRLALTPQGRSFANGYARFIGCARWMIHNQLVATRRNLRRIRV